MGVRYCLSNHVTPNPSLEVNPKVPPQLPPPMPCDLHLAHSSCHCPLTLCLQSFPHPDAFLIKGGTRATSSSPAHSWLSSPDPFPAPQLFLSSALVLVSFLVAETPTVKGGKFYSGSICNSWLQGAMARQRGITQENQFVAWQKQQSSEIPSSKRQHQPLSALYILPTVRHLNPTQNYAQHQSVD